MRRLIWLLMPIMIACSDSNAADPPDGDTDADAAPVGADASTPEADAALVTGTPDGTWAVREVVASVSTLPVVGATTNTAVTLSRFDMAAGGAPSQLAVTAQPCAIRLETSTSLAKLMLLPAYVASLPSIELTAVSDGTTFALARPVDVKGCLLANPATDALPTTAADPRVRDEDSDGNPGLTVRIDVTGLGQNAIYVVQRNQTALSGGFVAADRIAGTLAIQKLEQHTIGATNQLLATSTDVTPDAAHSSFTLVRVATSMDCAAIAAADEATLFGPR